MNEMMNGGISMQGSMNMGRGMMDNMMRGTMGMKGIR